MCQEDRGGVLSTIEVLPYMVFKKTSSFIDACDHRVSGNFEIQKFSVFFNEFFRFFTKTKKTRKERIESVLCVFFYKNI